MGFPTGYGFEFVESFNIKFVLTCELFIAFVAFVLAGLYLGLAREEQRSSTAVNIAMFVFLIGQFLYGVVLALGERWEAWRF
jgi:ammonia channel protein AmtB